jgi:hypothetical protein
MTDKTILLTGNAAEMRRRLDAIGELVITNSDQIKGLPWRGNFFSDEKLFHVIDAYIFLQTTSVTERLNALYGMGYYGMGVDECVTIPELAEYYFHAHDAGKITALQMFEWTADIVKWLPPRFPMWAGMVVKTIDTGESGVVVAGGEHCGKPVVVNMGHNALFPKVKMQPRELLMQVYVNPDDKATA